LPVNYSFGKGDVKTFERKNRITPPYSFSPYGQTLTSIGSYASANPFRFSTKYSDSDMELIYFGYRYYRPDIGQWLSRDIAGELGGENLFLFVYNRPIDFIDTNGRFPSRSSIKKTWNNIKVSAYEIALAIGKFPASYYQTAVSGEQVSSFSGGFATLTRSVDIFDRGIDLGPMYGQTDAYQAGRSVGAAAGTPINLMLLSSGIGDIYEGTAAAMAMVKAPPALALAGGGSLVGTDLLEFTGALESVGIGTAEAGIGIWNLSKGNNPWGRRGGLEHQGKINEIAAEYERLGYDVDKEPYFKTPEGAKRGRYIDVVITSPEGERTFIQVGLTNAKGEPVPREIQAIKDLEALGYKVDFISYGKRCR
jgi:RHS repeat-associated protein